MRRLDVSAVRDALEGRTGGLDPQLAKYENDPVGFAREILGVEPWSHQRRTLDAVAQHRRVAWRSSHGVGKTDTAAIAALWHVCCHPGSLVLVTAPSYRQVKSVFWRAVRRLHRNAVIPVGGDAHDQPESGIVWPDGRVLLGHSAGDGEKLAGFHAPSVLLIVDEASGVEQELFEAAKGALTGNSRMLLLGNPTKQSGEFFAAFNSKANLWHGLHTSAYDSPNITHAEPAVPSLIDQLWVDEMAEDYGIESATFSVRVEGYFPSQVADAVIPLYLVEQSVERWRSFMAEGGMKRFDALGKLYVGVDVARFGDDSSCIVLRRGDVILEPHIFRGLDTMALADQAQRLIVEHRVAGETPVVRVDTVGVGGGVADALRRRQVFVQDVNAGAAAAHPEHARMRDSLWFGVKSWLKKGGCLPPDQKLEAELLAPTYRFVAGTQKQQVESKDETRKRLRRSPDRADAVALCIEPANDSAEMRRHGVRALAKELGLASRDEAEAAEPASARESESITWLRGAGLLGPAWRK